MSSLRALHETHTGKVSDKWDSYLTVYDELFKNKRSDPIALLEIGVQNGGSLEIWGEYFAHAKHIIGCDINPKCADLTFNDPRIELFVGDANDPTLADRIIASSDPFEVIIDDGSHRSGDIIKSFITYFPHLKPGGIFVVEDLHCSYWKDFEGGLFYPLSSMAFFRKLVDVINKDHWGIERETSGFFDIFQNEYKININGFDFLQILSIEFKNSICIIRKSITKDGNALGHRNIGGSIESVVSGHQLLNNSVPFLSNESKNQYSNHEFFQNETLFHHLSSALTEIDELHSYIHQLKDQQDFLISRNQSIELKVSALEGLTSKNQSENLEALSRHSENLNTGIMQLAISIDNIQKSVTASESIFSRLIRRIRAAFS